MTTSRIALIAAATSLMAWIAKAVAIGAAGGPGHSPLEDPLFFLGFGSQLVASIALALALTVARPLVVRIGAIVGGAVVVFGFVTAVNSVIQRVQPIDASWVWGEINLWVVAVLMLGLALLTRRRVR